MSMVYEIKDLTKIYSGQKQPANQQINLNIRKGEIFGILGANGAGKTTLIRQMLNLEPLTSGTIRLCGEDIAEKGPLFVSERVSYMPQGAHALNNLTVGEALYFTCHLGGMKRAEAKQKRDEMLALMEIESLRDHIARRLSGGQKRLVQLAIALVGFPSIVILDEPTNELDPQRRHFVWDLIRKINHENGMTIIFISHDAVEAEKVVHRVAMMREGRVIVYGKPSDLKRQIDRKVHLEIMFSPDQVPQLPEHLDIRKIHTGRWLILIEYEDIPRVLNVLNLNQIDDFRLYSTTLEDLFIHYAYSS